jgi:hypothetical protein
MEVLPRIESEELDAKTVCIGVLLCYSLSCENVSASTASNSNVNATTTVRISEQATARRGLDPPAKSALYVAPELKEIDILQAPRAVVTVQTSPSVI